ncbi:MAG: MFS transporter [Lentisphaerae bacterium]|jgi:Na+/melibiose symporter-like transporter|nr:MFS transporter [Lentisphaerota bacterium]
MSYAATLTEEQRRKARWNAICSALYGCTSELMLDSSAVIITYIALLNGSDMFSMLSSSLSAIAYVLLLIPLTGINDRLGLKRSVRVACRIGCGAYIMMALAPFFGEKAPLLVILAAFIYTMTKPLYLNTWYPLLDNFLLPQDRTLFFSRMRFLYMVLNAALFSLLGMVMGRNPPIWFFQLVIVLTGLSILGRSWHIDKLPVDPAKKPAARYRFREAFATSIRNGPLTGFSVYISFVTFGYAALVPLVFIYLKSHLDVAPSTVITISGLVMSGTIAGYLVAWKLQRLIGTKWMQVACHLSFICISVACFFCGKENPHAVVYLTLLLILHGFASACFGVCFSAEIMALARPGNKTMATAFCNTYSQAGLVLTRTGTSLVIGSGMLASSWQLGERIVSSFQTLFLIYAVALTFCLLLVVLLPSVVPKHEDYYEP